jgi:hypothetical protein
MLMRFVYPVGVFCLALIGSSFFAGHFAGRPTLPDQTQRRPKWDDMRSYRFTARITTNDGVSPFKVGEVITGQFCYDLKGANMHPNAIGHASFKSARNAISLQTSGLRFSGRGDVLVTVGAFPHAEHFQIVASDLAVPNGWDMDHGGQSQTYGIVLQNAPPQRVILGTGIPDRLSLTDFSSTRELRLDFFHGVRFPGGQVIGRAIVSATVEGLEECSSAPPAEI